MKNQTFRMTMLYDFYGEILTERQREFYDLYYNEDLSLAEIAENYGISRQGVRDVIVRAEAVMTEIEDKTGIVKRFMGLRGKIDAIELDAFVRTFYADGNHEHMVFPGMVYISHPTEYGTLYTLDELTALHEVCTAWKLPLYLDGARLGYGLVTPGTDVTLPDVARLTDVFYIGGTKVGALVGEAVVFPRAGMPAHFVTMVKQHGALLAKGRVLGVQFDALFTNDLYTSIAKNALECAALLRTALQEKGYTFLVDSPTNQILVVLENARYEELSQQVGMSFWERVDDTHTAVRFATSWATRKEDVEALIALL